MALDICFQFQVLESQSFFIVQWSVCSHETVRNECCNRAGDQEGELLFYVLLSSKDKSNHSSVGCRGQDPDGPPASDNKPRATPDSTGKRILVCLKAVEGACSFLERCTS